MGNKMKDWMKQVNTIFPSSKTNTVLGKTVIQILDTIVNNGLYTSRSEAIRNYTLKGIKEDIRFLKKTTEKIEDLQPEEVKIDGETHQILRRLDS